MSKVFVTAPAYITNKQLFDLAQNTLSSIQSAEHQLTGLLIWNGGPEQYALQLQPQIRVLKNSRNCVARAWNLGILSGLKAGAEYVLIINLDVVLGPHTIDRLVDFANAHPEAAFWTASNTALEELEDPRKDTFDEHPDFSCFLVNAKTFQVVGLFDENIFPAYFEDNDYHYRCHRQGVRALKSAKATYHHIGSAVVKNDPIFFAKNASYYDGNRQYLIRKWGIDFHGRVWTPEEQLAEGYPTPYNNPALTIRDWFPMWEDGLREAKLV